MIKVYLFSAVLILGFLTSAMASSDPEPIPVDHFPTRLHAVVWRNWGLISSERMGHALNVPMNEIRSMAKRMGLPTEPKVTPLAESRTYLTVIRRNWHLLSLEQLTIMLGWTKAHMDYTLKEDDFLWIKLGSLKPRCEPIAWSAPNKAVLKRELEIAKVTHEVLAKLKGVPHEPQFAFIDRLSRLPKTPAPIETREPGFNPAFCYSYFAPYGDPLSDGSPDPYPDGYLAKLRASGVTGVWLQAVLYKLSPFPWNGNLSEGWERRLENLRKLTVRAKKQGIGIYLYLNEPRTMPTDLMQTLPKISGVREGDSTALCTSTPEVKTYLSGAIERICIAAPDLAGFFTITASENMTNCWSHHQGMNCPRCGPRGPATVIAEVNEVIYKGILAAKSKARLIAWDWGWDNKWAPDAIRKLPPEVATQSVSEWDLPITRGGISSTIEEYSLSAVGPGPRALAHWRVALETPGRLTLAKVQANCTWELSTVPYIPAVLNAAKHAVNVRNAGVKGVMLGWTLGGHPSPNLDAFAEAGRDRSATADAVLDRVAQRWGGTHATTLKELWIDMTSAFSEYPYSGATVYNGPVQLGPANLLYDTQTKYSSTMVGFPYDDINGWRGPYPPQVFEQQWRKMAEGCEAAAERARKAITAKPGAQADKRAVEEQIRLARACGIHFESVANQCLFYIMRSRTGHIAEPERLKLLARESTLAEKLLALSWQDSRLGFEASNQYAYVWQDLVEKVINCRWLAKK